MSQRDTITINENLQAALDLAEAGIPVFPFKLVSSDEPGKGPRKVPCITDWPNRATPDKAQLRRWFAKWPDAMPGIPMGPRTGWAVLDVDRKNGKDGFAELRALGFDPEALSPVIVQSPGGSLHHYFRWTEGMGNSGKGLPPGLDVRGEGGYVAAPGATHEGGSFSLVSGSLGDPLPDWPETLRPRLKAQEEGDGQPSGLPFHVTLSALSALPKMGTPSPAGTPGWRSSWPCIASPAGPKRGWRPRLTGPASGPAMTTGRPRRPGSRSATAGA